PKASMPPLWLANGCVSLRMSRFVDVLTTFGFEDETRYSRITVLPTVFVKFTYSLWLVLKPGWKARPRRPCSDPLLTSLEMFRNAVDRTTPFFWRILILPVFSTMKVRPLPSFALVA